MLNLTIAGLEFQQVLPEKYSEGHKCSAGEAGALQQTFAENIRNNLSKVVKDEVDKATAENRPPDIATLTKMVAERAAKYEFGAPRETDPVRSAAVAIATAAYKKKIGNKAWTEMSADDRKSRIDKLIEANPRILEVAKSQVAAAKKVHDSIQV